MLRVKLRHLAKWNEGRRQAAARYRELLSKVEGVVVPYEPDWSRAIYHLYVIRTAARDALQAHLSNEKIGTGLHYPVPVHLQNAYKDYGFKQGDFPITERISTELLSLPMFPTPSASTSKNRLPKRSLSNPTPWQQPPRTRKLKYLNAADSQSFCCNTGKSFIGFIRVSLIMSGLDFIIVPSAGQMPELLCP